MSSVQIICIECPLACRIRLIVDESGEIAELADYQCKIGKKYAEQEYKSPERVLTTTVRTTNSVRRLLPVRSDKPVPKDMLKPCIQFLANTRVEPRLRIGDVVTSNILATGADIVVTDDLVM